jgi:murein DD-endopeptidase MepM/ murein hydrolase activator NlpD
MRYPFDSEKRITFGFWASYPPAIADLVGHTNHWGIDFDTKANVDPIYAIEEGYVGFAGADNGLGVRIEGKSGTWRYWHLSQCKVSTGQKVHEGQLIGIAGASGGVDPHTHIELQVGRIYINWLEKYKEVLMAGWEEDVNERWFKKSFPIIGLSAELVKPFDYKCKVLSDKAIELQNKVKELEKGFEPVGTLYRKKV